MAIFFILFLLSTSSAIASPGNEAANVKLSPEDKTIEEEALGLPQMVLRAVNKVLGCDGKFGLPGDYRFVCSSSHGQLPANKPKNQTQPAQEESAPAPQPQPQPQPRPTTPQLTQEQLEVKRLSEEEKQNAQVLSAAILSQKQQLAERLKMEARQAEEEVKEAVMRASADARQSVGLK